MAVSDNRVKKVEVVQVTPFSNSTSQFTIPLTYFDTQWLKIPPVQRLFFYQIPQLNSDFFNSAILPKLKHSLSLTIRQYLPLAGNLMWPTDAPKPAIYYFPNDGVSVTVAESNADFNFLSADGFREAIEFHPLIPQQSITDDKAEIISIQITLFPNEGFSIGISYHHAVLDGKSSTMFIKSWAYFCKQGEEENPSLLPELAPCFDRTVIKDRKGLDVVYVNHWLAFAGKDSNPNTRSLKVLPITKPNSNLFRATYELTRENIKKLRDKVLIIMDKVKKNEDRPSEEIHLSTYVLVCAYVFVCLVKAKGEEVNASILLVLAADCRSRLDPPPPVNYFGNCVAVNITTAKASDFVEENGIALVAEKISDLVKGLKGDVIEGSDERFVKMMGAMKLGVKFLLVAGSNRFDIYGSDFGWGRPKKVEIVSTDRTGAISLAESRNGRGGVEVGVVLEKQQMPVFASLLSDGLK